MTRSAAAPAAMQAAQVAGIVREVGVHLADVARVGLHAPPACRPRRSGRARARPVRCITRQRARRSPPPGRRPRRRCRRASRRPRSARAGRRSRAARGTSTRDVLALVVGGDDDQDAAVRRTSRQTALPRARPRSSCSTTPSQVISRARAKPASPSRRGLGGVARRAAPPPRRARRRPARATKPLTSCSTNSSGPPASARRDDRLAREKRLERHVAVVFLERREEQRPRARQQLDQLARRRTRPASCTRSRRARAPRCGPPAPPARCRRRRR